MSKQFKRFYLLRTQKGTMIHFYFDYYSYGINYTVVGLPNTERSYSEKYEEFSGEL